MEPREKAAQLPESPGAYLFKDATGTVLYVGKARNLRSRVRSYFTESRWIDAKTGSLAREIADLETIVVGNEREALALEHNLIKRYHPKFNVLLRDDKTYPYIKFTAAEKYPRVYFTRRIRKDGSLYFGPYFPASLARRILHFVHKRFLIPSCTVEDIEERQRIAAAQGDDTDVLAYHEESPLVAANLFHLRGGRVVDRREFYWEDLEEFEASEFVVSLLKQLYLDAEYLPKAIHVPEEFEDRELLEEMLSEQAW